VCPGARVFYDLDTPITLDRLERGERVFYVPTSGLADFDLVLSSTGGRALEAIRTRLHARRVAALYGTVDPAVHHPVPAQARFLAQVSHLGTYSSDRRRGIEELFIEPARRLPEARFLLGGAQYPGDFPWQKNVWLLPHVPPREHPAFFSSTRLSLNVTRGSMARWGHCPSGRLFEAAACGVPQVTDEWEGLNCFLQPGKEICVARSAEDVLTALDMSRADLKAMARAARERVLDEHSATKRAKDLLNLLGSERPIARGRSSVYGRIPSERGA
jgi:spore maturation protein CgeB